MIKLRPYVPSNRIAVRDSIDEVSDDVDDDVFIKDTRSAKLSEEKGLKRPLMAPRRKNGKIQSSVPIMKKHRRWSRFCEAFCYGLAAFAMLFALISLAGLILTIYPMPKLKVLWEPKGRLFMVGTEQLAGKMSFKLYEGSLPVACSHISSEKIWSNTFPRMNSESPVRAVDLNGDAIKDIIFGYGVDDNVHYEGIPLPRCKSPQQGDDVPCEGGVIAVDGRSGQLLWQTWGVANVFSLVCALDINQDGFTDCLAAGRLGMIFAINGRNGNIIWEFREQVVETNWPIVMDLYTINIVRDLNGDEVPEIIAAHLEEREDSKAGHLKLISGQTGKVIRTIPTPYREEVFVPTQVITRQDGTEVLLIITGGQNTPGGIYSLRLLSLMEYTSEKEYTALFRRNESGLMAPAVLTDITGDDITDIIVSAFNGTVYAFDGHNNSMIWNYTFPSSESVSAIVPGHWNYDNITDFMVKYNTGPGFPVYYYSQTTILDGLSGQPMLDAAITDSGGSNSLLGGLSISRTLGTSDYYLHSQIECRNKKEDKLPYEFVPDSDIILQARADTCRLRYNESAVVKFYVIANNFDIPGALLFSPDYINVKLNRTQRPKADKKSALKHPKLLKKLLESNKEVLRNILREEQKQLGKTERPSEETSQQQQIQNARKKLLEREMFQEYLPNNELPVSNYGYMDSPSVVVGGGYSENNNNFNDLRNYGPTLEHDTMRDYDYGNEVPPAVVLAQNEETPIRLRSKYPGGRDIRSHPASSTQPQEQHTTIKPLTLWDLEMEIEHNEALKEALKEPKKRRRRKLVRREIKLTEKLPNDITTNKTTPSNSTNGEKDWYLASIASSGVLVKSLNNTPSTLDYVFVLNVRESETYPPLFTEQDLNCVQEKISAYKSYTVDNLRVLRKQFLKQCLSERLVDNKPEAPQYESQVIIMRIAITCKCQNDLKEFETCSEFNDIDDQRWTQFMGNDGNGYYPNKFG